MLICSGSSPGRAIVMLISSCDRALACGQFPAYDGRNQESTSEAINAWYAVALLGMAAGDMRLRDLGRLLLGSEVGAACR